MMHPTSTSILYILSVKLQRLSSSHSHGFKDEDLGNSPGCSVAARGQRLLSRFTALYICAASIVESVCFHTGLYENKPTVDRAPPILVALFSCPEFAAQVYSAVNLDSNHCPLAATLARDQCHNGNNKKQQYVTLENRQKKYRHDV